MGALTPNVHMDVYPMTSIAVKSPQLPPVSEPLAVAAPVATGAYKILVIEDEPWMRELVKRALARHSYQVVCAANGEEGLRLLYAHNPDLVILDLCLPGADGWEICQRIGQLTDIPVIMLSALNRDHEVVRGLDSGAVDYLTKPFSPIVLGARVRAALRIAQRTAEAPKPIHYSDGYLTVDVEQHRVVAGGQEVQLTATEFNVLVYLLQNAQRICTVQQILEHVWGWEYQDSIEYVYTYIGRLRKKIERNPKRPDYLIAEHGVGYRFVKAKSGM